jgi:LmbE family N-acetylglucosaminyl deacetylase
MNVSGPILILAPHPDDEIGCAATIYRLCRQGLEVWYHFFSPCKESTIALGLPPEQLLAENSRSLDILGVPKERRGGSDIPVRHFPQYRQTILEEMTALRHRLKPKLVLAPNTYDVHQDHATVTQEAIRAFKHCSMLGYELPWNTLEFRHDCLVPITADELKAKLGALECYASQESRIYANRRFFESLANIRGVQCGTDIAECFEVIRLIM